MSILSHLNIAKKILFPAPSPAHYQYDSFADSMFWLPKTEKLAGPIPCLWLPYRRADVLIIFSHGNGCDIGSMYETMRHYRDFWKAHVLLWEYPGYGCCLGQPSEEGINNNMQEVYTFVRMHLRWPSTKIVFYGQSIGTGPVCHMAAALNRHNVHIGGIVLQSPYTSIKDVVKSFAGGLAAAVISNRWNNVEEAKSITDPILIIHGQKDKIIPYDHSEKLFESCVSENKHLLLVNGASHNEFDHHHDIISPIRQFCLQYPLNSKWRARFEIIPLPVGKEVIIDRDLFQVPSQVVRALAAQDSPKAKAKKNKKKKKKKKEKKRQKEEQRQREEAERVGGRLRTKRDRRNNATSDRDPRGVRRGKSSSSIHSNRAQNGLGNDNYHDHDHDHDGDALETMRALKRKVSRSRSTADLARSRSRKYKQNDDNDSSSSDSSDSDSDSSSDGSGDSGGDGGGNGDGNGNGDAFIVPSLGGINSAVSNFFGSLTKDATTSALSPPSSFVASDHPLNRLHSSKDTSRRKQRGGGKRNSTNTHRSSRSKRGARSKPPPPSALALSSRSASAATSSTAVEAAAALMAPGTLISTIFNTSSKPDPQHHTGDGGVGRGLTRSASAYLGFEDNSTAPSPMSSAPTSPMLSVNTSAAPVRGFESITPSTRHPRPSQSHTPYLRPDYMQDVEAGVGSLVFDDDALKNIQVGGGSSRDKDRQRGRDRDRDRERERERKTTRRSSRTERSKKLSKRRSSTRRSKRSGGSSNDTDTVSASMSSRGGTPKVVMSPEQVPSSLVSSSVAQAASLIRRNDSTGTGQHATRSGERTTNHTRKANVHSSNRTRVNKSKGGVGGGSRRADANKRIFEHDVVPTPSK